MTPTNHPLTETAAEVTDEMRRAAASAYEDMAQVTRPENHEKCLNAALEAVLTVTTSADPRHDPRPWQDCTVGDIRKGDLVEALDKDGLRIGVAHHQDTFGDWFTEANYLLTYDDNWPLRRIPAPTPPAEEVELPDEYPAHITDVVGVGGTVCAYMALDRDGFWTGVDGGGSACAWEGDDLTAFTLPDGTRARRDGKRADGTPRFVKVQEGEK